MITMRLEGARGVMAKLDAFAVSPVKERRILRAGGRAIITATRARVRAQTDVEGKPFAPRKRQPNRQMVRRLGRHLRMDFGKGEVTIFIGSGRIGRAAKQIQEGIRLAMTSASARRELADEAAGAVQSRQGIERGRLKDKKRRDKVFKRQTRAIARAGSEARAAAKNAGQSEKVQQAASSAAMEKARAQFTGDNVAARLPGTMCTRKQAQRLQQLGFRKTPTSRLMKWFTRKQAGFLIRKMEGRPAETAWEITIPSRRFLGVPQNEQAADRVKLRDAILKELERAA